MDIKSVISSIAPTQSVRARAAPLSKVQSSAPAPSAQVRQFIQQVSQSSSFSAVEKQGLIEAASIVDQFIQNSAARGQLFEDIAGMGVYLKNTGNKEFPRWGLLTGLRYYGLNRDADAMGVTEKQAKQLMRQKLEVVAQSRNVTYEEVAVRQAQKPPPVRAVETAKAFGNAVEQVSRSTEVKPAKAQKTDIVT